MRCVEDMRLILDVLTASDPVTKGDFWREQPFVKLKVPKVDWKAIEPLPLKGKRIGVPKMYIGLPHTGQSTSTHPSFPSGRPQERTSKP
jgi:amidase